MQRGSMEGREAAPLTQNRGLVDTGEEVRIWRGLRALDGDRREFRTSRRPMVQRRSSRRKGL